MSPRRSAGGDGDSGSRVGVTALLLVVAAVGMLLLVRARPSPQPFDTRSEAGNGTRGLLLLLQQQGATVAVGRAVPQPGEAQRVLVLQDRLNDEQRDQLSAFAEAGGVVVMADPGSAFVESLDTADEITGGVPSDFVGNEIERQINVPLGSCDIAALAHLRGLLVTDGLRFEPQGADQRECFAEAGGAFVLAVPMGDGVVVQLGDNELFTNRLIRYADNGPLATALLAPTSGAQVTILLGDEPAPSAADIGSGDETLSSLVRPGVWMAIAQLAIAFVVFAIARAVRPGRPVREPEQVPIAGSELVAATGNLMQRARHAQRAGWLLRGSLYRDLCRRYSLPPSTSISALDEFVAARTSLPPGHVAAVLETEVHDNATLLQLSSSLHTIRELTLSPQLVGSYPEPDEGAIQ
jgi:hypothetical protein